MVPPRSLWRLKEGPALVIMNDLRAATLLRGSMAGGRVDDRESTERQGYGADTRLKG